MEPKHHPGGWLLPFRIPRFRDGLPTGKAPATSSSGSRVGRGAFFEGLVVALLPRDCGTGPAWTILKVMHLPADHHAPLLLSRVPNYEAVELSTLAGTLLMVFAVAVISMFIAQGDRWRRFWCVAEDPRSVGLFRILFGICCACSVNELWPQFRYLFTDEGMFATDVAQQIRARAQFAGYGDGVGAGELWGFYDFWGFVEWLKGPNYSLLLFDSSPSFFWLHLWAFELSMFFLIIGFQTRWVKWVAWFLFHGIILRNSVYWEGTEHVYRTFFFYLALSRCGEAYSVDNWLRCRRLKAQGRLSLRETAGQGAGAAPSDAHPKGLQAVYRRIPRWPRILMMLQIAVIYLETGAVKNGSVWLRGDAFYYALNLDHFYRVPPQALSALLGTTLFRLNSWVVHVWECAFPLLFLGLVIRWARREKLEPLSPRRARIVRASALVACIAMGSLIVHLMPAHTKSLRVAGIELSMPIIQSLIAASVVGIALSIWSTWTNMGTSPSTIKVFKKEITMDQHWCLRWLLGRRVWLTIGLIFHFHLVSLMNIGWFNLGIAAAFIVYLNGQEVAVLLHRLTQWLRSVGLGFLPDPGTSPYPDEDPGLPHLQRCERSIPSQVWWAALMIAVLGVCFQTWTEPDFFGDLGDLYRNFSKIDLGPVFAHAGPVVYFNWFFLSIIAGIGMLALRVSRGFALARWVPAAWVAVAFALGMAHASAWTHTRWLIPVSLALFLLGTNQKEDALTSITPAPTGTPWAYGTLGRSVSTLLCAYHIVAVGIWLIPDKQSFETFRVPAREQAKRWLTTTQTTQSWKMFAPNPPRSNMFLKTVVINGDTRTDLKDDVYACFEDPDNEAVCTENYPMPWIAYTRKRKINRRIAGGTKSRDGWWQKWHARWICKQWAYDHNGELPDKVELIKVWYPIATPQEAWEQGPYDPAARYREKNKEKVVYTAKCKTDPTGQPYNEVRTRLGLPEVPESQIHYWYKNRCRAWEKRRKNAATAKGQVIKPDDPYFTICSSKRHKEILEARKAAK